MNGKFGGTRVEGAAGALRKIRWGAGVVGYRRTARGIVALAAMRARRPDTGRVVLPSGGTIAFDYPSQLIPALVVFGDVIDPELFLVPRLLTSSSVAVDAGAAIGQFTVLAGCTPGVTIHCFEPSSDNVASLRRNIDANRLVDRVVVHQAALSSQEGEATFHTSANTYLSGLGPEDGGGRQETVPVRVLDAELERLGIERVDLLKVNVAGYEAAVLRGALGSFSRGAVGALIVLIGHDVIPLLRDIGDMGYGFYFYAPRTKTLHPVGELTPQGLTSPPTPARHVIGLRSEVVDHLRERGVLVSGT